MRALRQSKRVAAKSQRKFNIERFLPPGARILRAVDVGRKQPGARALHAARPGLRRAADADGDGALPDVAKDRRGHVWHRVQSTRSDDGRGVMRARVHAPRTATPHSRPAQRSPRATHHPPARLSRVAARGDQAGAARRGRGSAMHCHAGDLTAQRCKGLRQYRQVSSQSRGPRAPLPRTCALRPSPRARRRWRAQCAARAPSAGFSRPRLFPHPACALQATRYPRGARRALADL
jgi:hypothetical protein